MRYENSEDVLQTESQTVAYKISRRRPPTIIPFIYLDFSRKSPRAFDSSLFAHTFGLTMKLALSILMGLWVFSLAAPTANEPNAQPTS